MIQADRQRAGIRTIERLISIARFLALKGNADPELANFLDQVCYLPQLMLETADCTDEFIACLKQLCAQVPNCQLVLDEFENA